MTPRSGSDLYRALGVEPIINCKGTFTIIGGSIMAPEVVEAMALASQSFVQLDELAEAVGGRLAELTGAEWAMVTAGCAAAIKLATLACLSRGDPQRLLRLPDTGGLVRTQVIIPASSRNTYDQAIRSAGATVVTVQSVEELEATIGPRTAMVYLLSTAFEVDPSFSLEAIAAIAHRWAVPVLVDAAAEGIVIPNPHLQAGANLVAYSGGKAMRGPQSTGVLLGEKNLLRVVWQASAPRHGPGRDNKVSREEQVGLLTAVELWLRRDRVAEEAAQRERLGLIARELKALPNIVTTLLEPEGLANRSAVLEIRWAHDTGYPAAEEVLD